MPTPISASVSQANGFTAGFLKSAPGFCLLLLFPLYLLFHDLFAIGLLNNVEAMYAEIAREMLVSGHWVIPHLNDVPYIEKPPLMYWLLAASMRVFGVNEFAVRLVPVLSGLGTMAVVAWFGRRLLGLRYGLISAFLLGTSIGFVMMSRIAYIDTLFSAWLTAALLLAYCGVTGLGGLGDKSCIRAAALCLALAVMAKGFLAVALFGLTGLAWIVFCRPAPIKAVLGQFLDPWAIAIFLAVLLPWHIAAAIALPQFSWFYFINEHVYRFIGMREPPDFYTGSVFYYLPRLTVMALPWLPLVLLARRMSPHVAARGREARGFLWCCVLAPLVFFSASSAKANYYVIVCLPALALLAGMGIEHLLADSPRRLRTVWCALAVAGCGLVMTEHYALSRVQRNEMRFSSRPVANEIRKHALAGETLPVLLYRDYENLSSLPFYLQRPLAVVDSRSSDLLFGQNLGAGKTCFISEQQLMAQHDAAWLVVAKARSREFQESPLSPLVVPEATFDRATLYRLPARR